MKQSSYIYSTACGAVCAAIIALTVGCGTTKNIAGNNGQTNIGNTSGNENSLAYLRKVNDNAVYAKYINAKANVTLNGKSLPVSAQVQTTQGKMIRLSLTALGLMEVGRMEMTPNDVLIIDRVHKKFARKSYDKVKFMAQNGLNFYTLEALIRNQLFLPGQSSVGENHFEQLHVEDETAGSSTRDISCNNANMTYTWRTNSNDGLIRQTTLVHKDAKKGNSTLQWQYSNFTGVGKKQYPTDHLLTITLADKPSKQRTMHLELSKINTTTDNSDPTTPSNRYEEVDIDELFQMLMNQ